MTSNAWWRIATMSMAILSSAPGAVLAQSETLEDLNDSRVQIEMDGIASINATDAEDLLKYAPNLFVRKRYPGDDQASIALRGTSPSQSARTLVILDGYVISNLLGNSEAFSPKWNVVSPSEVQRVDILYGPYAARYGGNSMGGVINFTTLVPEENGGYVTLQSLAMPFEQYGVDETFTGYRVEAGGSWKKPSSPWTIRVGARHLDSVGQPLTYYRLSPSAGPNIPVSGAYAEQGFSEPVFGAASPPAIVENQFSMRVGYDFQGGWNLSGLFVGWLEDRDLTDARTFLKDANATPIFEGRVRFGDNVYIASGMSQSLLTRSEFLAGIRATGDVAGWQSTMSLSHYWIDTADARASRYYLIGLANGLGILTLQDDTGWWTLDAAFARQLDAHRLTFGINASQYETRRENYETSNWRVATDPYFRSATFGRTRTGGIFAEDQIALSPATSLTLGVRADGWQALDGGATADFTGALISGSYPDRDSTSVDPKISLQQALGEQGSLRLTLGTATRFPTVDELFQGHLDAATLNLDPNSFDPNLAPEQSNDAELVVERRFEHLRLASSLFYQDVRNAILEFPGINQFGVLVSSYKNVDRMRQYGIELTADANDLLFAGLDAHVSVARIDARTLRNDAAPATEDQASPGVPDWRTTVSVDYRVGAHLRASMGWRYASAPSTDLSGTVGDSLGFQTGYSLVDARLSWNFNDSLDASIGVDNLTNDRAYVVQPLAQRTGFAQIRVSF